MALREGGAEPGRAAAQQLAELGHSREPSDDKTVVVVWFGCVPNAPPAVVTNTAAHFATARIKPSHVASTADDMFTAAPKADLADLDDLFTAYAQEMSA